MSFNIVVPVIEILHMKKQSILPPVCLFGCLASEQCIACQWSKYSQPSQAFNRRQQPSHPENNVFSLSCSFSSGFSTSSPILTMECGHLFLISSMHVIIGLGNYYAAQHADIIIHIYLNLLVIYVKEKVSPIVLITG